jgi:hypothetical protein
MKTAVSIPDPLFEEAERLAKVRGLSRSALYAAAVADYVKVQRNCGVREQLDAVYGARPEDSALDPMVARAQLRSLPDEDW